MNIEQIQQQRYKILVGDCTFNLNLLQEQGYIEGKAGNNRITAKGIHSYEDN